MSRLHFDNKDLNNVQTPSSSRLVMCKNLDISLEKRCVYHTIHKGQQQSYQAKVNLSMSLTGSESANILSPCASTYILWYITGL